MVFSTNTFKSLMILIKSSTIISYSPKLKSSFVIILLLPVAIIDILPLYSSFPYLSLSPIDSLTNLL